MTEAFILAKSKQNMNNFILYLIKSWEVKIIHIIGSYPLTEAMVTPYIGRPVVAVTHHGDRFVGTLQSCESGQIYLVPCQSAAASPNPAVVQGINKKRYKHSKGKRLKISKHRKLKASTASLEKARISWWGFGLGLAAGLGFAIPLLALGALFLAPFWI